MKYIHHHLGLGDHIICNGMVRYMQKKYDKVSVFSYHHNFKNVSYMYSDNENITVIPISSDSEIDIYCMSNNINIENIIKVGFSELSNYLPQIKFDEAFYKIAGIEFSVRFESFFIPRNREREIEVYNELNPNNESFIFLHEDKTRGFFLDRGKIPTGYKIIENDIKYNVFDLLYLFENAEEIHLMQSSIKDLINSYVLNKPKIVLHNYVRRYGEELNSIGLNKINIID